MPLLPFSHYSPHPSLVCIKKRILWTVNELKCHYCLCVTLGPTHPHFALKPKVLGTGNELKCPYCPLVTIDPTRCIVELKQVSWTVNVLKCQYCPYVTIGPPHGNLLLKGVIG